MDQDAFRDLLASGRHAQPNQSAPSIANGIPQKATTSASSQPAFKPRKIEHAENKYRNRAAERRAGTANDYAQVEAVLEDFQKRVAHEDKDVIERQRKYLGGDSEHTILVKGLDLSLLEQNRARATTSTEDDDILEQAFAEVTFTPQLAEPRKRTREDIIRDLKAKRHDGDGSSGQPVVKKSAGEAGSAFETAKKAGKFRPIGFQPIGQTEEKSKKRKVKGGKEGVKKKQKVDRAPVQPGTENGPVEETPAVPRKGNITEASSSKTSPKPPEPELTPVDEDFDIFTGAGDYEGFPVDGESDEERQDTEETRATFEAQEAHSPVPAISAKSWFDEPEPDVTPASPLPEKSAPIPETTEEPLRLKPLESSTLPSIRDFLAMDEAAVKTEKRKARKEKKKKKRKEAGDDDDD